MPSTLATITSPPLGRHAVDPDEAAAARRAARRERGEAFARSAAGRALVGRWDLSARLVRARRRS